MTVPAVTNPLLSQAVTTYSTVDVVLTDESHALTAKYEGGAAGRYVTRELRVKSGAVDPNSPGSHGRFTAKAKLTATFGTHDSFAPSDHQVHQKPKLDEIWSTEPFQISRMAASILALR